jgi:alpha-ketoglutarate-dependent 2,4-dichlorophenoxyacetate dioxygenase
MSKPEVRPFETGFGAEIVNLDLSKPLTAETFKVWEDAFEKHGVVVLRGQNFTDAQHVEFSKWFGKLEDFPDPKDQASGLPTVLRVSNVERDSNRIKPIDDAGHKSFWLGTSDWHTDSSYRPILSKASLLFSREIPNAGGDTMFAHTGLAFDALPAAKKAEIEHLVVVHDFEETRRRNNLLSRPEAIRKANPPVRQPLVRRLAHLSKPDASFRSNGSENAMAGRRALLLGSHIAYVEGMDEKKSKALIAELTEFATQPAFTYRHKWRLGDLVMWDNRCTMHRAMEYDMQHERRVLHRTTVAGEAPLLV